MLDLARGGVMACLPFPITSGRSTCSLFVLSACSAAPRWFYATVPDLLTNEADSADALSLSRLAYELENLLSPALRCKATGYA